MPEHLLASTVRGRLGTYTVGVYARDGDGSSPVALDLDGDVVVRYGRMQPGFGGGTLPSATELPFEDPGGVLASLFAGLDHDEAAYYVRVSGPNGRGGTFRWEGAPMQAELGGANAPLVYPRGRRLLRAYDRLGAAADTPGRFTAHRLDVVLSRLALLQPTWRLRALLSAWPEEAADRLPRRVRFPEELAGDGGGDYGTLEDQLAVVLRAWGLALYQPTDWTEEAGPRFELLPRYAVGQGVPAGAYEYPLSDAPEAADAVAILARTLLLLDWGADEGGVGAVRQVGTVTFRGSGAVSLTTDPRFEDPDRYWDAGGADPHALAPGERLGQRLADVTATPGVRVRLTLRQQTFAGDTPRPGAAVLTVTEPDGTVHALPLSEPPEAGDPGTAPYEVSTTEDFPAAGELRLDLEGGTPGFGLPADWRRAEAHFVDAGGEGLAEWVATVGDGRGEAVELPLFADPLADDGSDLVDATWYSPLLGQTYARLVEATAAERLAQQGRTLAVFTAEIEGLVGPETRLVVAGRDAVAHSPFPTARQFVAVGLELSLGRGTTRGVWCEAVAEVAADLREPDFSLSAP